MSLLEALGLQLTPAMRVGVAAAKDEPPSGEGRPRSKSESDGPGLKGATPGVDQARFEARWSASGPGIEVVRAAIKTLGTVLDGPLLQAIKSFEAADAVLVAAVAGGDPVAALAAMPALEAAVKAYDAAFPAENATAQAAYLKLATEQKAETEKMDRAVAANAFGSPPIAAFDDPVGRFTRNRAAEQQAVHDGNYLAAHSSARLTVAARMLMKGALARTTTELKAQVAASATTVALASGGALPGAAGKALTTAHGAAAAAVARIDSHLEIAAAYAAVDALTQALQAARQDVAKNILAGGAGKGGAKASREKALAYLKQDPEALKWLQAEPGGKAALDAMVGDLGGAAKSKEDKAFVRAAIEARFGPKLGDTDLTAKYLPRLYKSLGMVPESHTKNNPKLTEINRTRVKLMPSGDYSFDEATKKGVINLATPKTGSVDWLQSKVMALGADKIVGHLGGKNISTFDALTLHEVGHAVDEEKGFMDGKAGNVTYGGWQAHSIEEVAAAVGTGKGFFKDFATLPRAFLDAYLKAVLEKKKPADESGVTGELKPGDKPDWKALARHPAVECAEHIRLKNSDSGLWDRGDGGAAKYAIGSSVYQEAYEGQWVSYALAARGQILCNYQFRSAAEWFAEPYAAFFLGKLKPSHPMHAMLKSDQDAGKAAERAAR